MFIHPQPPTAQRFELGYDRYLRVLCISNLVMVDLFQDLDARIGMHLEFDRDSNVIVKLYLLGHSPKAQLVSSQMQALLVSSLESDVVFVHSVRDAATKNYHFPFEGEQGETAEEIDRRIANEVATMMSEAIRDIAMTPGLVVPGHADACKSQTEPEFLKKVTSVADLGYSSNYQAHFSDGSAVRYTMPTHLGEQIKPGDYLYHDPAGVVTRVDARQVH